MNGTFHLPLLRTMALLNTWQAQAERQDRDLAATKFDGGYDFDSLPTVTILFALLAKRAENVKEGPRI